MLTELSQVEEEVGVPQGWTVAAGPAWGPEAGPGASRGPEARKRILPQALRGNRACPQLGLFWACDLQNYKVIIVLKPLGLQ